jgi:anti-sigma regulatory factor (Ser/Thr protein kinase)
MEVSGGPLTGSDEVARDARDRAGTDVLLLAPEPASARIAREWITAALEGWAEGTVERARIIVSELVTNAVLHARTSIALRLERQESRIRVDVEDGDRTGPLPKRFVADSPTGRGMHLVDALAEDWGVSRLPDGKVVWFVVGSGTGPLGTAPTAAAPGAGVAGAIGPVVDPGTPGASDARTETATGSLSRWPELEESDTSTVATGGAAVADTPRTITVRILQLPIAVYVEAEQHNDAVVRELALIAHSPEGLPGTDVPTRLVELANAVWAVFAAASNETRYQVERALREGREVVDLRFAVPADAWRAPMELSAQLDEIDRFCEEGQLLTLASSPRLRRFRAWYTKQVADQIQGLPASPWPYGP